MPEHAVDGNPATRWCALGPRMPAWVMFILDKPLSVKSAAINWESEGVYQYMIEGSADGKQWKLLVDQTKNAQAAKTNVDARNGYWRNRRTLA